MHDVELDGYVAKKGPEPTPTPKKPWARIDGPWIRLPIPRRAQAAFAEAFRQALVEGLGVLPALTMAAEVNPCRRFRRALDRMAGHVRAGDSLWSALARSGAVVRPGLLAALRVGEEGGGLVDELGSFASRAAGLTAGSFRRAIGRRRQAVAFAAALARQLRHEKLTVHAVWDAGHVAADGDKRFERAISRVVQDMEDNGASLGRALARQPAYFDPLFCGLVEAAGSREELRACLGRLGE